MSESTGRKGATGMLAIMVMLGGGFLFWSIVNPPPPACVTLHGKNLMVYLPWTNGYVSYVSQYGSTNELIEVEDLGTNTFGLVICPANLITNRIQDSTNLTEWRTLLQVVGDGSSCFTSYWNAGFPQRFFRVVAE